MSKERQDNTTVAIKPAELILAPLPIQFQTRQDRLYDADEVDYYRNLQDAYNYNAFGYGLQGTQTNYNPATNQTAIQSNYDYAKNNALGFLLDATGARLSNVPGRIVSWVRGPFAGGTGNLGYYTKYINGDVIGKGAEATVIKNTPITVAKMTAIPVEEIEIRNMIPAAVKNNHIGYVRYLGNNLPTYVQNRMRMTTSSNFPTYIKKLDKTMGRSGYRVVNNPNVQYRAYTNGDVVIDDITPGNLGIDWFGRPRLVDFSVQTIPEWRLAGYYLKNGGSIPQPTRIQKFWFGGKSKKNQIAKII